MEKEKLEGIIIDYIDGRLSAREVEEVEKLLSKSYEAQRLHQELREVMSIMDGSNTLQELGGHEVTFAKNLKSVQATKEKSGIVFLHPVLYRVAAAIALVMVGIAGGFWINKNYQHNQELAVLRKEMTETKQLMMAMLSNGQSASQRMQGVSVALTISTVDDEVVKALSGAMSNDQNTNVRLAALDALSQFVDEPQVKAILISSLSTQDDPMVQIALIQLLVRIKEKNVINAFEKIIDDNKSIQAVKDEAYTGIIKLS